MFAITPNAARAKANDPTVGLSQPWRAVELRVMTCIRQQARPDLCIKGGVQPLATARSFRWKVQPAPDRRNHASMPPTTGSISHRRALLHEADQMMTAFHRLIPACQGRQAPISRADGERVRKLGYPTQVRIN
jgi:hypothetical protein